MGSGVQRTTGAAELVVALTRGSATGLVTRGPATELVSSGGCVELVSASRLDAAVVVVVLLQIGSWVGLAVASIPEAPEVVVVLLQSGSWVGLGIVLRLEAPGAVVALLQSGSCAELVAASRLGSGAVPRLVALGASEESSDSVSEMTLVSSVSEDSEVASSEVKLLSDTEAESLVLEISVVLKLTSAPKVDSDTSDEALVVKMSVMLGAADASADTKEALSTLSTLDAASLALTSELESSVVGRSLAEVAASEVTRASAEERLAVALSVVPRASASVLLEGSVVTEASVVLGASFALSVVLAADAESEEVNEALSEVLAPGVSLVDGLKVDRSAPIVACPGVIGTGV